MSRTTSRKNDLLRFTLRESGTGLLIAIAVGMLFTVWSNAFSANFWVAGALGLFVYYRLKKYGKSHVPNGEMPWAVALFVGMYIVLFVALGWWLFMLFFSNAFSELEVGTRVRGYISKLYMAIYGIVYESQPELIKPKAKASAATWSFLYNNGGISFFCFYFQALAGLFSTWFSHRLLSRKPKAA